jgi:hypothetical protein
MPLGQYRLGALDKSLINGTAQSVAARPVAAGATASGEPLVCDIRGEVDGD